MVLAEIERRRAHQVADVLDEQEAAVLGRERFDGVSHHVPVEMAALPRVDLQCARTGRANSLGVIGGLLIALDDRHRELGLCAQVGNRPCQQRCFAGAGR